MAELRRLSKHCDFKEYLSEALRDRLVCGLRSEAIQRRLLSQKDLTLESAYDIALSEETASQRASELQVSVKTAASPDVNVQSGAREAAKQSRNSPELFQVWQIRPPNLTAVFISNRSVGRVKRRVT